MRPADSSLIARPDAYSPRPHRHAPIPSRVKLTMVKNVFLGDENQRPLLMKSQKAPQSPYENQLQNSDVIRLSRLLNSGTASAMTQATVHSTTEITTQVPIANRLRRCICSVLRNTRT